MSTERIDAVHIHFTSRRGGVAALCAAMATRMAPRVITVSYEASPDIYDAATLRVVAGEVDIDLPPPAAPPPGAHAVRVVVLDAPDDVSEPDAHTIVIDARRSRRAAHDDLDAWRTLRELLRTALGAFFARGRA